MAGQSIKILSGLQHIRRRPGVYVGDVSTPTTLLKELVDNALDEYLNGYAKRVEIDYKKNGWCRVRDDGRGLPLERMESHENRVTAGLLFTEIFSSGKFESENYEYSVGLHGLGLTAINALSHSVDCFVNTRKGKVYHFGSEKGITIVDNFEDDPEDHWWTTSTEFMPDDGIFRSVKSHLDTTSIQLAKASRPKGILSVNNSEIEPFDFRIAVDKNLLCDLVLEVEAESGTLRITLQFGWSEKEFNCTNRGSVNLGPCRDGWHIRESNYAVGRALHRLDQSVSVKDAVYGLRSFTSLLTAEPIFTSQTKEKLSWTGDVKGRDIWIELEESIYKKLKSKDKLFRAVIRKIFEYKKTIQKLSDQDFINSVVRIGTDKRTSRGVAGIYDCTTRNRSIAEIFICEGKSAAGNMVRMYDSTTQAILPLRGKPLNVVVANDVKAILENAEMVTLVNSIGVGLSPNVDLSSSRYGRIIIATDADPDGRNISSLLVGAFCHLVPEILDAGMLYEVIAPLYKQGSKFIYSEDDLNRDKSFDRFKGLGSMDPDETYTTLLNPNTRILNRIVMDRREDILDLLLLSSEKKRLMVQNGIVVEG